MESDRLKRIMDVLGYLATSGPQTVTAVSTALALPVSSTHDLLKAMVGAGMASATSGGYDVGPVTARLAFKISQRLDVASVASAELQNLQRIAGFDVYLAVQTGLDVIYASRFRGRQGVNIDIPLGLPLYRHATAAGKLFAAYNPEVRRAVLNGPLPKLTPRTKTEGSSLTREFDSIRARGLSISREEAVTGIIGLAAPILLEGVVVGAVHISAIRSHLDDERLAKVNRYLLIASERVSARLQGRSSRSDWEDEVAMPRVSGPLAESVA